MSIADSVRSAFLPLGIFLSLLYGVHGTLLFLVRSIVLTRRKKGGVNADNEGAVLPQRLLVASSAAIGGKCVCVCSMIGYRAICL